MYEAPIQYHRWQKLGGEKKKQGKAEQLTERSHTWNHGETFQIPVESCHCKPKNSSNVIVFLFFLLSTSSLWQYQNNIHHWA